MTSSYPIWGWGGPGQEPDPDALTAGAGQTSALLGFEVGPVERPMPPPALPASRVAVPIALRALASDDPIDRARHSLGRSYSDVLCGIRGELQHVPDLVLRPRDEADISAALDWAAESDAAVVPFGGGTSVVGGVTPDVGDADRPVVSLDLALLSGVLEIDPVSRAARIRAGTLGPALQTALDPHGLTLRFFPQSFERSTVGGWLATRAAGHFASRLQHIDDLVESVRAVTPIGTWQSRRLPGSGAGPSPDRMLLGSEGTLGVITEAWLRVQDKPRFRAATTLAAPDLLTGASAVRALLQSGLAPATLRLVDPGESTVSGTLTTGEAALVLGAESPYAPVEEALEAAITACLDHGLRRLPSPDAHGAAEAWRGTFVAAPYLREQLMLMGVLVETFETAVTWDALPGLVSGVTDAVEDALRRVCGGGTVSCRFTHAYPDGVAPYFTVLAPASRGGELSQWAEIKAAASDAVLTAGGTITHHHAVGRDHRPWYDQQRPDPFAVALAAAKHSLDPAGVLNPGVLIGP